MRQLGSQRELSDLGADPSEQNNLIAQHPEMAEDLEAAYRAWIAPMPETITGANQRGKNSRRRPPKSAGTY
jgi:hypothetical protein